MVAVATIGIATAFFRLGSRGFWGDEVWQVWWTDTEEAHLRRVHHSVP